MISLPASLQQRLYKTFQKSMTGSIYKILPLYENKLGGINSYVDVYLESLVDELLGAVDTFEFLVDRPEYVLIINTIQYISHNELSQPECKREVFKMLDAWQLLKDGV